MTLDDVAKNHNEYIKMAMYITKNESIAKDIVQDMYLKLAIQQKQRGSLDHVEYNGKPSPQYIFRILRTLFYDRIKADGKYKCCQLEDAMNDLVTQPKEMSNTIELLGVFPWYPRRLTEVYFNHQHSIRSLAKITTISEKNIWLTLKKTKTYLKKILEYEERIIRKGNGKAYPKDNRKENKT